MRTYRQLDLDERAEIAVLRCCGRSIRFIAQQLGRLALTISREVSRNAYVDRTLWSWPYGPQSLSPLRTFKTFADR